QEIILQSLWKTLRWNQCLKNNIGRHNILSFIGEVFSFSEQNISLFLLENLLFLIKADYKVCLLEI
ncbi:MAG: hypothetical protein R3243_05415, partial [Arenibacter latericius]|nr:hypothetical protein [Arenibacter latericius]